MLISCTRKQFAYPFGGSFKCFIFYFRWSFLQNSGVVQAVTLNPSSVHQPIATTGYQLVDPVFGSQNDRSGVAQPDQFAFSVSDLVGSSVGGKVRSRDDSSNIWSDDCDGIRSGSGYFLQETNVSSHPTQVHHVTETKYQLVNPPVFAARKVATSTSSVQFIPSSSTTVGGIGQNISNFVQDTSVPICPAQEMAAVQYQIGDPVFVSENVQSTPERFVLPVSNTVNEHFIGGDNVIQKILTPTVGTMEPSRDCGGRGNSLSSPIKENSLLRELHSAPSMDKSIEVMLQENSTECYRFVEQFASNMNSRSNVVSNAINAENEITRIAQQLAQSAGDALRSVDGSSSRMRSSDSHSSPVSVDITSITKSVDTGTVEIRSSDDKKEMQ